MWIEDMKNDISNAQTMQTLQSIMLDISKKLSCDFIIYNIQIANSFDNILFIALGNFPSSWLETYQANDYAKIDPVLIYCIQKEDAIYWHSFDDKNDLVISDFFQDAKSHGLVDGLSKGLRKSPSEVGILSIAKSDICRHSSEIIDTINALQVYIHDAVIRLSKRYKSSKSALLTPRENESLHLMVKGYTSSQISQELDISESTAIFHIKNIIEKLDAKNRTQAVARAVLIGLVNPSDFHDTQVHDYHWKDI